MHAGEKNSSPRPQDIKNAGVDGKKRTRLNDGQTYVSGRAKLAAQLSPATGMQKCPGSRHSKEEVCHLSHEINDGSQVSTNGYIIYSQGME